MSAPVIKALGNFNLTSEIHKVVKKKLIDWIDNNRDVKVCIFDFLGNEHVLMNL